MGKTTRRTFLKTTAAAAGVAAAGTMFPGRWIAPAFGDAVGYFEKEFGITDALCERILAVALSKGGDFADLYFENTVRNWVILEDGQVNQAYGGIDLGVGIRTVKGDQVGYGFTQELTEKSMVAAAATAATIADANPKEPAKKYVSMHPKNHYPLHRLLTDVPLKEKLPPVQNLNDRIVSMSPLIANVNAGFHDEQKRIMIVTSEGNKVEDLLPRNYLYASVVAEKKGRKERAWWNFGGRRNFDYYSPQLVDTLAKEVVDRVLVLFDATVPPAGEMPVVLGPGVTGILLHEAIGHGMEADFNRKKISTYSDMVGKKVAEPFVTIVDDGTNKELLGSINVDDEGNPSERTVLVENGILKGYLHDRISSEYYKVKPTGNGRRQSYQHYPLPRMRNTYMLNGPDSPEDVIKGVKKGIYVEDVSNGQVKIGEGDFAFYISLGKMIEDGKLTAPIKDVNIMGNGPKMLKNVVKVGNDLKLNQGGAGACGKDRQRVPVSFGLPTILVKSLTVGGKKA